MGKRYAIGDIHGRFAEFKELLKNINFDYDEDELISLGDIVDYGPEPFLIMFEMLKMKNCICVRGNHDEWLNDYILDISSGHPLNGQAGSMVTMIKWAQLLSDERLLVKEFLDNQVLYHIDSKNNLFVHAGIDTELEIEKQDKWTLFEERYFFETKLMSMQKSQKKKIKTIENFNEIFIGHTPSFVYKKDINGIYKVESGWNNVELFPIHIVNVWNIDTGAKMQPGRLSIINIDTHEVMQQEIY